MKLFISFALGFWLPWFIPSVDTAWIGCDSGHHSIYGADNLRNGTVRLYSGIHYWNLELIQLLNATFYSVDKSHYRLLVNESDFHLVGHIADHGKQPRLIADLYQNLNTSMIDDETISREMVSLPVADSDAEYTFLMESYKNDFILSPENITYHVISRVTYWDDKSGQHRGNTIFYDSANHSALQSNHNSPMIQTLFQVSLNHTTYLFIIIKNRFYWSTAQIKTGDDSSEFDFEWDRNNIYHRGRISSYITASFVIQPSDERIWVVIFYCDLFCIVTYNASNSFFDFSPCEATKKDAWKSVDQLFENNISNIITNFGSDYKLYRNYRVISSRVSFITIFQQKITSIFTHDFDAVTGILIAIGLLLLSILLFLAFCNLVHSRNHEYNLGAVEARDNKRNKKGIYAPDAGAITALPLALPVASINNVYPPPQVIGDQLVGDEQKNAKELDPIADMDQDDDEDDGSQ